MTARLFSRSFLLLCTQFLAISTVAAIFFPLQLYLASLGIPESAAGFIIGADALAALFIQPFITPFVAARTARRWLLGGSVALTLALLAEGTVTGATAFTVARLLQGAGFICIMTAFMPLMVLCIPVEKSGQAFGWISMIRLVPYASIPPLFGLLDIAPADLGTVIRWSALLGLLPALLLCFIPSFPEEKQKEPVTFSGIWNSMKNGNLLLLLAATLLVYSAYAVTFYFLKGMVEDAGFTGSGLFFTVSTLVMLAVRLLGGSFFDRFEKARMGGAALAISAAATFALPFCGGLLSFLSLAFVCGIGWGISMPLLNAIVFSVSEPAARGLNQNLAFLMMQGGFFLGPLLGGGVLDLAGYQVVFTGAGLLILAAALFVLKVDSRHV